MKHRWAVLILCAVLTGVIAAGLMIGPPLPDGADARDLIVFEIRLPRVVAAALVGAALGLSGAALQALLRNPLADPGVLGVSACASLGAVLVLAFGAGGALGFWVPIAAGLGALAATIVVGVVAARTTSATTLLLFGVGLSSFAGAATALAMNLAPHPFALADLINWLLGSVANKSMPDIASAAPVVLVGAGLLWRAAPGLTALSIGEEAGHGVGLDLRQVRALTVIGAGLLTGAAVGLAGAVGFVGLLGGHLGRVVMRQDPGRALWPAALCGAILLVIADLLVRVAPGAQDIKLGVASALLGAPAFVWIALRMRGGHGGA